MEDRPNSGKNRLALHNRVRFARKTRALHIATISLSSSDLLALNARVHGGRNAQCVQSVLKQLSLAFPFVPPCAPY